MANNVTTLSEKGQISVPKALRDEMKWKPGQEFAFIPKGTGLMMVPVPTFDDLFGMAKGADPTNYRDRNDRY